MDDGQLVQTVADTVGGGGIGLIAVFLWKLQAVGAKLQSTMAETLEHTRRSATRAERHYDTEEELYRSLREDHAKGLATAEARAETNREMIRIRTRLDTLERPPSQPISIHER